MNSYHIYQTLYSEISVLNCWIYLRDKLWIYWSHVRKYILDNIYIHIETIHTRTRTHAHIHMCVFVCACIFINIYITLLIYCIFISVCIQIQTYFPLFYIQFLSFRGCKYICWYMYALHEEMCECIQCVHLKGIAIHYLSISKQTFFYFIALKTHRFESLTLTKC